MYNLKNGEYLKSLIDDKVKDFVVINWILNCWKF